jgi:hypothetical protein
LARWVLLGNDAKLDQLRAKVGEGPVFGTDFPRAADNAVL